MSVDILSPLLSNIDVKLATDVISQGALAFLGLLFRNFYTTFSKDYANDIMKLKNIKNYGVTVVLINIISLFFSTIISLLIISFLPPLLSENTWVPLLISIICGAVGPELSRGVSRTQVKGDTLVKSIVRYLATVLNNFAGGKTIIDDDIVGEYGDEESKSKNNSRNRNKTNSNNRSNKSNR